MEYRFDPSASKPGAAPAPAPAPAPLTAAAAAQLQVQVPFVLSTDLSITDHGGPPSLLHSLTLSESSFTGTFELRFVPRANALDGVAVELYLGTSTSSATCSLATSGSEWTYLPSRRTLRWSLPPPSTTTTTASAMGSGTRSSRGGATLQGTFASADAHPRPARAAQISFALPSGALHSTLKVDQLKLSGETYKPYKGVRGRAFGRVEWRVEWQGG